MTARNLLNSEGLILVQSPAAEALGANTKNHETHSKAPRPTPGTSASRPPLQHYGKWSLRRPAACAGHRDGEKRTQRRSMIQGIRRCPWPLSERFRFRRPDRSPMAVRSPWGWKMAARDPYPLPTDSRAQL
ncbi:transmembrane protein 138 isoform X2 [Mauremys mutica]|uniref:transmembrane protein 138 isoform X2 n=1 Tax=Mauremys mutica TaxID=74926 RepID=UPI001D16F2A7|nr:transmembrane protein 138 isoform X2 [Mauremys mutica]